MEIVLKLYTYVDGTNDTPFPNAEEQAMFTFTYDANRMGGSPQISATVKHRLCLDDLWNDKVYAEFRGEKYFIMNTPSSDKDNTDERYNHDIQLLSEREVLNHVYFIDAVQGDSTVDVYKSNSTKVIFFGDVNEFVGRLNACLSYQNLEYTAVLDSGVTSEDKQVSFEDKYILEALQEIFNVYEIPYYFVGKVIHVGFTENTITYPLKYGFDEALLSISKQNANYALINKIKGQGSSDNIPYYYPNNSPKGDIGIKIVSGSMIASNFVIFDYVKFSSAMSLTDVCTVRREQSEDGILNYFIWSIDGKDVELSDLGIRLADNVIPMAGSSFMQEKVSYITPMPNLMPSIYRESLGAQQFYEAKNNTYEDGEGGYYEFENEYSDTNQRQGTTDFEDIKPTIEGMTNASGQRIDMFSAFAYDKNDNDETDEEGNYIHSYFFAKLRKFDGENGFNLFDHAIESQAMQISFTSGVCGACTFEIGVGEEKQENIVQVDEFGNLKRDKEGNVLWNGQTAQPRQNDTRNYEVWIALKKENSTYGIVFPNVSQNLKPSTNDTFVILGIDLPTAYITAAEKRLEQSLIKYMWMNNTEKFTFSIKFSRIFFTEHPEVLEQLNENSRVLIEYNGQQHTLYVDNFSYKTDDSSPLPEIEIDLVDTLSVGQNSLQTQLDSVKQDILSSIGGGDFLKQGLKYFLRKDVNDVAQGKITFRKGLDSKGDVVIGENGFAGGLTGFGAKIGSDGRAEMRALTLWEFLEVPELRYNSVKVFLGIDWQVAGAGIIESCTPDTDEDGNVLTTGTCTLKLEDGQYGAVDVDDIALGIWHFGNSNDATEDTDDGKGGFTFAGFATAYFRITEVSGANNGTFRYSLRPNFNVHPQSQMTFACYGNFTNTDRQTSTYRTRTYTRRLWKQNTWEIGVQNIAMQEGDLSNLSIFDMDMTGYSMYINSVYFTGTIAQVKPDGTPVMTANDRGAWVNNTKYDYYDRVSHNGCIWLCVNEDGTDTEPSESNPNWLLQVSKGDNGQDGTSFRILGSKDDESQLPTDGNEIGDGYLINGHLWVWNGTEWNDAGVIQGPAGESVINMGGWYDGLHVPYLGVVRMGNATFMCTVENGTYNPPYYTLLDNSGNRLKTNLGYIITGDINNAEYQLIAADGADGKDGLDGVAGKDGVDGKTYYTWIRYADDAEGNGISNDPTGKAYIGFAYNKESPLESNDPTDYTWSDIKGEQGVKGEKGEDGTQYYTWIAYSDNPDGNPMYQQPTDTTKYIGIAVNKTTEIEGTDPSEYTWSKFKGEDGRDGLNGADGVDGKDGTSIIWKGDFLTAPLNPQNGWAYKNTTDKKSYVYQDGTWYQMTIDGVDGQNGADGLSIVWKGDLAEAPANPQTNWAYRDTDNGRVYIYNGSAWELMVVDGTDGADGARGDNGYSVYITYNDSETEPSTPIGDGTTNGWHTDATSTAIWMSQKVAASSSDGTWGNPIKIKGEQGEQGDKGDGFSVLGQWYDGLVVPYLGVVTMGGNSFAAKVATTNPPMWTLKDNNGNRIKSEKGYILTGEYNTEEYDLIAEKGQDGIDGLQGADGKDGIPGKDGVDGKTTYFHIKYSENANGNPMTETPSTYIGTYVDFEESDSDDYTKYAWARFEGLQGEKGEQGIPGYNGVDGKTYYLHIKYSNDGGSTFTGNNGEDVGDYIGVYTDTNADDSTNPSDYKWSKTKGDGYTQIGQWYSGLLVPKMGVVSMGGGSYVAKVATYNPPLWTLLDNNGNRLKCSTGYLLTGSVNTTEYDVWSEKGDKGDKGEQGDKGDKGDTGAQGKQGIDGCIVRDSEWAIGTKYHNDSNITDGSLEVRYIDVALVRNDAVATGWDAYRCKLTHVASSSITYENTSYWEKFSTNVGTIFTSLIIAKNAKIKFLQGNQLTIQKSNGTITAGLSGSESGEKIRIWAGSNTPDTSPFRVTENGEMWATDAHIQGEVNATSGLIGGLKIIGNSLTNEDNANNANVVLKNNSTRSYVSLGGNVLPAVSGTTLVGDIRNEQKHDITDVGSVNYGIRLSARNAHKNVALDIDGGCIRGFAVHNTIISKSITTIELKRYDFKVICLNTNECTITLPQMNLYDDGHIIRIKRLSGAVKVRATLCYTKDMTTTRLSVPAIIYSNGQYITGGTANELTMNTVGDGVELTWVRDISGTANGVNYYGAWIVDKISYM